MGSYPPEAACASNILASVVFPIPGGPDMTKTRSLRSRSFASQKTLLSTYSGRDVDISERSCRLRFQVAAFSCSLSCAAPDSHSLM